MPIFALSTEGVKPFRRLNSGVDVYESEIERLFWENLEAFSGEPLFAVARQARLRGGGIPDILALDAQGRVVLVEIKRDVDRGQLAQCLEYAGWARTTSLDELAGLYTHGPQRFFTDWQQFTGTSTPVLLERVPRITLVARSFDVRTDAALLFLQESGVPLRLIRVVFYEDAHGDRIVDVDLGDLERGGGVALSVAAGATTTAPGPPTRSRRTRSVVSTTLTDLLEAGIIEDGEMIVWRRPQVGEEHQAFIRGNGEVVLQDGRAFTSLSTAADVLTNGSHNGWECWTVPRLRGIKIGHLRGQLPAAQAATRDP